MGENKDQASGMKDKVVGNIKEGLGNVSGNENLRQEGKDQHFQGGVKDTFGAMKDKAADFAGKVEEKIRKTGS